jgi:hypothetical protein
MKNQRIKININRKPIEHQKVDDNKNFGAVMAGFTAITLPFYKKWWFWGATGTAVVAAAIIGVSAFNYKAGTEASASAEEKVTQIQAVASPAEVAAYEPFIKPAFKGFNVDFETYIVTSGQEKFIETPGGTKIRIPACHFLYADGSEVQGKVEIRFREMKDPVDFAVSGIPMTYDSAQQEYLFESAGMCEIQGYKNGKQVQVNPVCPITIEQKTVAGSAKFNMYYLDTVARNWQYIGQPVWVSEEIEDEPTVNHQGFAISTTKTENTLLNSNGDTLAHSITSETTSPQIEAELKELEKLKKNAPTPPKQYNSAKYNFNIVANSNNYPELQPFTSTVFEVDSLDKNFSPAIYNYNWSKAAIEETDCNCGKQNLLLSRGWIYQPETALADTADFAEEKRRNVTVKELSWWQRFWANVRSLFGVRAKKQPVIKKLPGRKNDIKSNTFQSGDSAIITKNMNGVVLVPVNPNELNPVRKSIKNSDFVTIQVYPILTGKDYDKAYAAYTQKLIAHNKLVEEKIARIEQLRKEAEEQRKAQEEEWNKQLARLSTYTASKNLSYMGIRSAFSAEKFGIYNTDNPVKLSKTNTVSLNFTNSSGGKQLVDKAYLVIKNRNALMANYYSNCCNNILTYGTTDNNQLFVVLPDDYVGVVEQADFNRFATNKNYTVKLRISPNPIKDTEELKTFLGVLPATETAVANQDKEDVFDR